MPEQSALIYVPRWRLSVADAFDCRCLTIAAVLCFHLPLIKPDMGISRIRLSDIAAPIATGWNDRCRAGITPAEEARRFMVQ